MFVRKNFIPYVTIIFSVIAAYVIVSIFTGIGITDNNVYNSYALQAQSWIDGRLDLGQNYEYLELAIFNNKYYVSFPPFPSFLLLPFVLIMGTNTPDNLLTLLAGIIAAIYSYKISLQFNRSMDESIFLSLFVTIGSNLLFIISSGGVWFMAQAFCFALSTASIYYALTNIRCHGHLSLGLWACAVGCRPFSAVYIPIILYLLYKKHTKHNDDNLIRAIIINWKWALSPIIIAVSYMILNALRFGSPISFGHEYLPEFVNSAKGQFNLVYIKTNFYSLFRLPQVANDGKLLFPKYNGVAFWLVSPIFISSFLYLVRYIIVEKKKNFILSYASFILIILNLFFIIMHKTMGGWHFGNRYTVDLLPFTFLMLMVTLKDKKRYEFIDYPLFILGLALNIIGTIALYNNWL